MPALQRGAAWAEERLLGALRQSVPQNGRVHLHIIDSTYECLTAFFRRARFKTHRHAVYHCLKEVQKQFRHASVFRHARFDTRVSVFKTRVSAHLRYLRWAKSPISNR